LPFSLFFKGATPFSTGGKKRIDFSAKSWFNYFKTKVDKFLEGGAKLLPFGLLTQQTYLPFAFI